VVGAPGIAEVSLTAPTSLGEPLDAARLRHWFAYRVFAVAAAVGRG
jgi:hypothetical protein